MLRRPWVGGTAVLGRGRQLEPRRRTQLGNRRFHRHQRSNGHDQAGETESAGSLSIAAGATLSMPGGGAPTNPTSNLIDNAGFESPVAGSNTTSPAPGGNGVRPYLSTQYAYTGAQSLVVSGQNSGVTQDHFGHARRSYTASVYAMTAGDESR